MACFILAIIYLVNKPPKFEQPESHVHLLASNVQIFFFYLIDIVFSFKSRRVEETSGQFDEMKPSRDKSKSYINICCFKTRMPNSNDHTHTHKAEKTRKKKRKDNQNFLLFDCKTPA